ESKLGPIVLEVIHICPEIHLNLLIHPLGLSISLQVESSTQVRFHSDHRVELLHESGHELGTPITHDFMWDSMVIKHMVLENPRCTKSSEVDPNPFNQCPLCKLVNN